MKRILPVPFVIVLLIFVSCMMDPGDRLNTFDPNAIYYPKFSSGYPLNFMYYAAFQMMQLLVKTDAPAVYYAVAVPTGAPIPTVAEVMAGQQSGGSAAPSSATAAVSAANTVRSIGFLNLGTANYEIYFVIKNQSYTNTPLEVFKVASIPSVGALAASIGARYDASDSASLTTNAVGEVAAWGDISGNARHMSQGTVVKRPIWSGNGFKAGCPGVTYDGVDDYVSLAAGKNLFNNVPGGSIFAVVKLNSVSQDAQIFVATVNASTSLRFALMASFEVDSKFGVVCRRSDADTYVNNNGGSYSAGQTTLLAGVVDYANARSYLYQNGILQRAYDPFLTAGTTQAADSIQICIGANTSGYYFPGVVSEIIVFPSAVSSTDQAVIEAYLMAKWGL